VFSITHAAIGFAIFQNSLRPASDSFFWLFLFCFSPPKIAPVRFQQQTLDTITAKKEIKQSCRRSNR